MNEEPASKDEGWGSQTRGRKRERRVGSTTKYKRATRTTSDDVKRGTEEGEGAGRGETKRETRRGEREREERRGEDADVANR
jgi:hypothetical protein